MTRWFKGKKHKRNSGAKEERVRLEAAGTCSCGKAVQLGKLVETGQDVALHQLPYCDNLKRLSVEEYVRCCFTKES